MQSISAIDTNNEHRSYAASNGDHFKDAVSGATVLKEGLILRYKKRYFKPNWRQAVLTLYNNATFCISKSSAAKKANQASSSTISATIKCQRNATLIIFGQQLKLVPKRPVPPSGFKLEQMLAIGLINHLYTSSGKLKNTQIIFYWFLSPSVNELLEWIIAFQNSLFLPDCKQITNNTCDLSEMERLTTNASANALLFNQLPHHLANPTQAQPRSALTSGSMVPAAAVAAAAAMGTSGAINNAPNDNNIAINSALTNVQSSCQSLPTTQSLLESTPSHPHSAQDDLSLGLLIANTQNYIVDTFMSGLGSAAGVAGAASAAGLLTTGSHMNPNAHLMGGMAPNPLIGLPPNVLTNNMFSNDTSMMGTTLAAPPSASGPVHDTCLNAVNHAELSANLAPLSGFGNIVSANQSATDLSFDNGFDCLDASLEFSPLNII